MGRIGAQTAKQVMIQKIREAERDSLFDEYEAEGVRLLAKSGGKSGEWTAPE